MFKTLSKKTGVILISMLFVYTALIGILGVFTIITPVWIILGVLLFGFASFVVAYRAKDLDKVKKGVSEVRNGNMAYKIPELKSEDMKVLATNINDIAKGLDESVSAIWKESGSVKYTVNYYLQNTELEYDEEASVTEELYGATGADVDAEIKVFTGFTYDADESTSSGEIAADGTLVLKVYYTRDVYSVTLRTLDGTINEGDVTTYIYGVGATLPTNVTKTGFVFGGWFADSSLEGTAVTEISETETDNKTFYAKWISGTDVAYTVEHYQEQLDGSFVKVEADTENKTGVTGDETSATAKTYEGFTVRVPVMQETIKADGTTVVKIYYTRNSYTLTFKPNNGERDYVYTLKYEAPITAPIVEKEGNAFTGWDTNVAEKMPASNLTYTATWSSNMFTVILPTTEEQASEGYTITVLSTPTDAENGTYSYGSEYSFTVSAIGTTNISGMLIYVNNAVITRGEDDVYRFAVKSDSTVKTRGATAGKHSVSYDPNGGSGVPYDAESYAANESVPLIFNDVVSRTGYTFLGWDVNKDAKVPAYTNEDGKNTLTMPDENVVLYAIWLRNISIDVTTPDGGEGSIVDGKYEITYDGKDHTISLAAVSGIDNLTYQRYKDGTIIDGAVTSSITVKNVADSGVYRCDVTYWQDSIRHNDSSSITVTVNKAPLTAVATDKTVVYGEETPEFEFTVSGLVGEDEASVVTGEAQYTTDRLIDSNVGDYTITIDASGLMAANYEITGQNGVLRVTPRTVTIVWPTTKRYAYSSGTERSFEATIGNLCGEDVVTAVMGGDYKKTAIGTYIATVTGLEGEKAGKNIFCGGIYL